MKQLIMACAALALFNFATASSNGQTTTTTALVTTTPAVCHLDDAPDLWMLTNHATLTSWSIKRVQGGSEKFTVGSQALNGDQIPFFQLTNDNKTLDAFADIMGMYTTDYQVVDPTAYIGINARLWDTNDASVLYGWNTDNSILLEGSSGGYPSKDNYGNWSLPEYSETPSMYLREFIKIPVDGIQDARIISHDGYNPANYKGMQLTVGYGEYMMYPSGRAGSDDTVVISTWKQHCDGYWRWQVKAYNARSLSEVQISDVLIKVLLHDSEDFKSFRNKSNLDTYVWSWNGYGKVPLLVATWDQKSVNPVYLSVHTDTQYATQFVAENLLTKTKLIIDVPNGATGVTTNLPAGAYHITPNLQLKSSQDYTSPTKG